MRGLGELATAVGSLIWLMVTSTPRETRFTMPEVLQLYSASLSSTVDLARMERAAQRAELAAASAERSRVRAAWTMSFGTFAGTLTALGVWTWLTH